MARYPLEMQWDEVPDMALYTASMGGSGTRKMSKREAERAYDKILQKVFKVAGREMNWTDELDRLGSKWLGSKYNGALPSDKMPNLTERRPYAILNLDSSDQAGSHWISIAKMGDKVLVYDSFGRKAKDIIDIPGKLVNTEADAEQAITADSCGQRSLAFLVFVDRYGAEAAMHI